MQAWFFFNSWVTLAFAFALGALSAWFARWLLRVFPKIAPAHAETCSLASLFDQRVRHFQQQVQTLQDHSNEYVAIFSGNEWNELTSRIQHLASLNEKVRSCLSARKYADAQDILSELYDPVRHPLDSVQRNIDTLRSSTLWEDSVRTMLKRVIQNLEAAAHHTKQLSQAPKRKRSSTLVTLADVKKALLEDEAFKREM